jgi:predicted amidohydrolase
MARSPFVAAAAQLTATAEIDFNLQVCGELARRAAEEARASLFILPECFAFIGHQPGDQGAIAEPLDEAHPGPILEAVLRWATAHRLWIVAGGMPELVPGATPAPGTRTYNTCIAVSPEGRIAARYRKIHLFDVDIPGRAQLRESDNTMAGAEPVVVETPLGRIGLSICYDLRFPELYRRLVSPLGAELLVVPAAFTAHTGAAHWHTLLRARAIENQCYVLAAAQTGQHNARRESYGHSLIVDPWGSVLDELPDGTGLAVATIEPQRIDITRAQMPCLQHRVLSP